MEDLRDVHEQLGELKAKMESKLIHLGYDFEDNDSEAEKEIIAMDMEKAKAYINWIDAIAKKYGIENRVEAMREIYEIQLG